MTRAIVVAGGGGVGKTTISAALAAAAAEDGSRALVVTVDPARRLADALGVKLSNDPTAVRPGLDAAMLDVTTSWEAIVHRYAEPAAADRLLVNPFFRAIADRFPAAQAYAAGEQMAEYLESGHWDVVVVDTPPSGGGIDFFLAPRRMSELVGGKLLVWLTGARIPGRRTIYRFTAKPALRLADAVLGGPLLEEVAEFLLDLRTMYDGLSVRAKTIQRHLERATTIIATTADPTPMRETRRFFTTLEDVRVAPAGVVFNRALPEAWVDAARGRLRAVENPDVRSALRENLTRWAAEARRQADARSELSMRYAVSIATVPWMRDAPNTVDELLELTNAAEGLDALLGT